MRKPARKRKRIKLNADNRGMTLVEVIIAITILGVVAVPVLRSLTTAMVYNAKARNRQDLTLKAESVMESFKGYSLAELCAKFGYELSEDDSGAVEVVESGSAEGLAGVVLGSDDEGAGGYECEYDSTSGEYTFTISKVTASSSTNQLYDVEIKAVPDTVIEITEPEDALASRDAVFVASREWDTEAAEKAAEGFLSDDAYISAMVEVFSSYLSDESEESDSDDGTAGGGNEGSSFVGVYLLYNGEAVDATDAEKVKTAISDTSADTYIGNYIELYERQTNFSIALSDSGSNYVVTAEVEYLYHIANYPFYVEEETAGGSDAYYDGYEGDDRYEDTEDAENSYSELMEKTAGFYADEDAESADGKYFSFIANEDTEIYNNSTSAGLDRLYVYYYPQYDLANNIDHDIINIVFESTFTSGEDFSCYIIKQFTDEISSIRLETYENTYYPRVEIDNKLASMGKVYVFHNFDQNLSEGTTVGPWSIVGADGEYRYTDTVTEKSEREALSYTVTVKIKKSGTQDVVSSFTSTMLEAIGADKGGGSSEEGETE